MSYRVEDTIAAIASPPGGAARGIVRLSGDRVGDCLSQCFRSEPAGFEPRTYQSQACVVAGSVTTKTLGAIPVELLYWPGERSYTRQPSAEIHTIGSPPLLQAVLAEVCESGARLAEPGEFTMRSFLAGRLDLTQAEAVLGVIDAHDRSQLNAALSQLAGGVAQPLNALRQQLLTLLAHLEAGLDFVEDDIEFITAEELDQQLAAVAAGVSRIAEQMQSREDTATSPRIILTGAPNAGKSSLLNALVAADTAIVSPTPGATRDYVEQPLQLGEMQVLLVDTAGIETEELTGSDTQAATISGSAQLATQSQQKNADLELFCLDASRNSTAWEQQNREAVSRRENALCILTKSDLPPALAAAPAEVMVSSTTGEGLDALRRALADRLRALAGPATGVAATASRCRESLREAARNLETAREAAIAGMGEELVAADVRAALQGIGQVTGVIYTDDILDKIFSTFCIGK